MTTVVYHSADFDGVFCREVAKRHLGDVGVRYVGWNFGVAACRLAWQWFNGFDPARPDRCDYIDRRVKEPLAIRLAGEYDVWDKRDANAELFQYGLRSVEPGFDLRWLLDSDDDSMVRSVLAVGASSKRYAQKVDAGNMKASFLVDWEGLRFLCLNGLGNSLTFASRDVRETGHDALLMFYTNGLRWEVS